MGGREERKKRKARSVSSTNEKMASSTSTLLPLKGKKKEEALTCWVVVGSYDGILDLVSLSNPALLRGRHDDLQKQRRKEVKVSRGQAHLFLSSSLCGDRKMTRRPSTERTFTSHPRVASSCLAKEKMLGDSAAEGGPSSLEGGKRGQVEWKARERSAMEAQRPGIEKVDGQLTL